MESSTINRDEIKALLKKICQKDSHDKVKPSITEERLDKLNEYSTVLRNTLTQAECQ
jgi:hypothetical protein